MTKTIDGWDVYEQLVEKFGGAKLYGDVISFEQSKDCSGKSSDTKVSRLVFVGCNFEEAEDDLPNYLDEDDKFYVTYSRMMDGYELPIHEITEKEKELLIEDGLIMEGDQFLYFDTMEVGLQPLDNYLDSIDNRKQVAPPHAWSAFSIWTGEDLVTMRNRVFCKPTGADKKKAIKQVLNGDEPDEDTGFELY